MTAPANDLAEAGTEPDTVLPPTDHQSAPHPCCRGSGQNVTSGASATDVAALERLRPGLQLMALRTLGNMPAAEEAAQETLARALVALQNGQPRDTQHLAAFVSGIARHVIADTCRARVREVPLEAMSDGTAARGSIDALASLITAAESEAVHAALALLAPGDQELLRLAFFEGLSPAQIAMRLGEPAERIRKRKSRALEHLRSAFRAAGRGHEGEGSTT